MISPYFSPLRSTDAAPPTLSVSPDTPTQRSRSFPASAARPELKPAENADSPAPNTYPSPHPTSSTQRSRLPALATTRNMNHNHQQTRNDNKISTNIITFDRHSFALYNKISDIRLIAMLNGIIVCSQLVLPSSWLPPVHKAQNTVSHVSQNSNSCPM